MDTIKRYAQVHPEKATQSFDLKRMEAVYESMQGKSDTPHRHDYYTILLIRQAEGTHFIDFHTFTLAPLQVYFISPGQVHQIQEHEKSYGCVLTFSEQFMIENGIESFFIDDLHLFQDFGYTPPLPLDPSEYDTLHTLTEQMETFLHSPLKMKYQAIGALLKLFLIHCNNACSLATEENPQRLQTSYALIRQFKRLLNQHYQSWHKVSEYAQALHITPDYLNTSIKSLTGKSAKEHIQSRLITAAKRLLHYSTLPTKSIAYQLGFTEPANFSQFFKKCTGLSPTKFKREFGS